MSGQNTGYMRVSTESQNARRQLAGIELHKAFIDKAIGSNADRPQLDAMLGRIREADADGNVVAYRLNEKRAGDAVCRLASLAGRG